jgi:hypothetical protein
MIAKMIGEMDVPAEESKGLANRKERSLWECSLLVLDGSGSHNEFSVCENIIVNRALPVGAHPYFSGPPCEGGQNGDQ